MKKCTRLRNVLLCTQKKTIKTTSETYRMFIFCVKFANKSGNWQSEFMECLANSRQLKKLHWPLQHLITQFISWKTFYSVLKNDRILSLSFMDLTEPFNWFFFSNCCGKKKDRKPCLSIDTQRNFTANFFLSSSDILNVRHAISHRIDYNSCLWPEQDILVYSTRILHLIPYWWRKNCIKELHCAIINNHTLFALAFLSTFSLVLLFPSFISLHQILTSFCITDNQFFSSLRCCCYHWFLSVFFTFLSVVYLLVYHNFFFIFSLLQSNHH